MPATLLLAKLVADYPHLTFVASDRFSWAPQHSTVHYDADEPSMEPLLLHELSHGLLNHADYQRDIELITMERQAWDKAKELATHYGVVIDDDTAESHLDTYREWIHKRSTCPACEANGLQIGPREYECPACHHQWRVNEARLCGLRRHSLKQK